TALYLMLAVAAWLVWRRRQDGAVRPAPVAYILPLPLHAAWTPVCYALYPVVGVTPPWLAFGVLVVLIAAVLLTILRCWPTGRPPSVLLVPYLAWLIFASSLNVWVAASAS